MAQLITVTFIERESEPVIGYQYFLHTYKIKKRNTFVFLFFVADDEHISKHFVEHLERIANMYNDDYPF